MLLRRNLRDLVIIGGGIAGLSAAWYASRRGLATALFEGGGTLGGQVATVNSIDDWPVPESLSGVELATGLANKARGHGVDIFHEPVHSIAVDTDPVVVESDKRALRTRRVLIASGARLRQLGVPGEDNLRGKGVSQCAHCDGHFFRDQDVVVIGGGDAALQEALVLAEGCRSVTIVSRSALRSKRAYVDRAMGSPVIRFVWDASVEAILGNGTVTGVRVRDSNSGEVSELKASGVFPFIGCEPNTAFLPPQIECNDGGLIVTNGELKTTAPPVLAIGAVRQGYGGELVDAVSEAAAVVRCIAADLAK